MCREDADTDEGYKQVQQAALKKKTAGLRSQVMWSSHCSSARQADVVSVLHGLLCQAL